MDFVKMHGCGNDFVVVAPTVERDWPSLARAICDRHCGVGADGLILVLPSVAVGVRRSVIGAISYDSAMSFHNEPVMPDVKMRIFNADGTEAEMCGNGIRCLARYAVEHGLVEPDCKSVVVETAAGIHAVGLLRQGGDVVAARVEMGEPVFAAAEIPVAIDPSAAPAVSLLDYPVVVDDMSLRLGFVSMGNPHAVCFVDTPVADFPLAAIGPRVETHPMFPKRANFEVAHALGPSHFEARVWERGVGETLACGSGACAIAVVAQLRGLGGRTVDITLRGGTLQVTWYGAGEVELTGPVVAVFRGQWPD